MVKHHSKQAPFPSKEEILAFIGDKPGEIGTREIARAFHLKNDRRVELKRMLRELADEGRVEAKRKKLHHPGALPSVTLADITGRDSDGELIATPTEWDEDAHGAVPENPHRHVRARPGPAKSPASATARCCASRRPARTTSATAGRVIKIIDKAKVRALGIFRALPGGGGRLVPIDKKQLGKELSIPQGATKDAQDGDLIAVSVQPHSRLGLPTARVEERLGSIKSERAVSLIAIHAHEHSACVSGRGRGRGSCGARRRSRRAARTGASSRSSPSIRSTPRTTTTRSMPRPIPIRTIPGGHILTVAIADVAHYVRPGSALDREALKRGNSVYFPDRVVPMLPERISNDLCSLRAHEDRAALAVRMIIGRDGRKRSHTFHRVLMRSAAKLNYQQAQAAISGRTDEVTDTLVDNVLKPLYAAYETLKKARDARGPLDLDLPERKILLKADGTVDRVITPERLESHRLIEEFMILANVAAAETLERRACR